MSNDNNTTTTTTGGVRPSPPQLIFDDGSRIMTEEAADEEEIMQQVQSRRSVRGSIPIEIYYEIDRIINEIPLLLKEGNNKDKDKSSDDDSKADKSKFLLRIAIQFPDELLDDSYEVCWLLEERLLKTYEEEEQKQRDVLVFVLGDTTVGSCCVDEIAALHLQADILIHYGHACLSPTGSLPVIYSFGKLMFNISDHQQVLIEQIKDKLIIGEEQQEEVDNKKQKKKLLILYHVGYHHAIESIQKQIIQDNDIILNYLDEVIAGQLPKPTLVGKQKVMLPSTKSCCGGGGGADDDKTTIATSTTATGGCCSSSSSTPSCMNDPNSSSSATAAAAAGGGGGGTNDNTTTTTTITSSLSKHQQQQQPETTEQKEEKVTTRTTTTLIVGGLELPITKEDSSNNRIQSWDDDFTNYIVLYIGNPESTTQRRQFINIMLRFLSLSKPPSDFWTYSPTAATTSNKIITSIPNTLKIQLKRRFFLTQKARDANIYGIVVSNLSQQNLIDVVKTIETKIKNKGKSSYNFAVGKINPAKLANFAEIDCFVLVACREQALLDNERDYHVPVITPLELDIALGYCDWGQQSYSLDCLDIMQMTQQNNNKDDDGVVGGGGGGDINGNDGNDSDDDNDDDAPYFSMVTGKYVHNPSSSSKKSPDLDLANLPGQGQVMEYNSEAANFLKQREYQGLQSDIGQTEVTAAIPGQQGIASNYNGS